MAAKKVAAVKKVVLLIDCPMCKTNQKAKRVPQTCVECGAKLDYQLDANKVRNYIARKEFDTVQEDPNTGDKVTIHWTQVYPVTWSDSLEDKDPKTAFIERNGDREYEFRNYVSIERFQKMLIFTR